MEIEEKKPEIVYRIIGKKDGKAQGSFSRSTHDEYDFGSAVEARSANCHNMFENRELYKIAKYKVTYELIEDDCDKEGDVAYFKREAEFDKMYEEIYGKKRPWSDMDKEITVDGNTFIPNDVFRETPGYFEISVEPGRGGDIRMKDNGGGQHLDFYVNTIKKLKDWNFITIN